tara:strand:- start:253 stop:957 length:705 start_codon:yes stop_codon:yes gene_type:complete
VNKNINYYKYLYIGPDKFEISINEKLNLKEIYKNNIIINNHYNDINLNYLDDFLKKNIFISEKLINNFIKEINIIVESYKFLEVSLSVKKKNHNDLIFKNDLVYLLNDAKEQCKETFQGYKIIHMIIENYQIDNNNYVSLPENLKCSSFSLDIKFICLYEILIEEIKKVLRKYQINIDQIICAKYANNLSLKNEYSIYERCQKIIEGINLNEILFVNKSTKNRGFFEKFFNLFS